MVGEVLGGKGRLEKMKSFLLGAIFGLIVGGGLVYSTMKPDQPDTSVVNAASNELRSQHSTQLDQARIAEQTNVIPGATQNAAASRTDSPFNRAGKAPPAPTPSPPTEMPVAAAHATTPSDPIPMHDAVRSMLSKLSDSAQITQKHSELEREPRDDSWSYYMEQMLSSYFAARAPQVGVEIVGIACRTTACEVQAIDTSEMPAALSGLLGAATRESWWEFTTMNASSSTHQGRSIAIVFLNRGKKKAATS
jgi:hypothetical protein